MGTNVTMEVVGTAGCVEDVSAIWACAPTPELGNGVAVQEGAKGPGPCVPGTVEVKPALACGSILKSTCRGAFIGGAVATEPNVGDIEIEWTRELTLLETGIVVPL